MHYATTTRMPPSSLGLRNIDLLEGLAPSRLDVLARQCAWRHVRTDERIISRAEHERDVYFIASGRVRVTTYSSAGREVAFRDFGPGEHFGEVSAIDGEPRPADVVALADSLVASLPPDAFSRLLAEEPGVAARLLNSLAGQVRRLSERIIDLSTLDVQHRLHVELLRMARGAGIRENRARISPAPRHADLAGKVSTYREQVTRAISWLARCGVVRRERRALVVADVAGLARLIEEARFQA